MNERLAVITFRQERFAEEYVLCGNATEAARRAGYSKKTARQIAAENLTKPVVLEAIRALQAENSTQFEIAKEDVIRGILSAINMAREQKNPGAMISGCVQLAKLMGFYDPEVSWVELSDDAGRLKAKFASMSDEELLKIVAAASPQ